MRSLIVEDDPISCKFLAHILSEYGRCDVAVTGIEAVEVFRRALNSNQPYDLICMDIILPEIDGQEALKSIRKIEKEAGIPAADRVNVFMTTSVKETEEVAEALNKGGAAAFYIKPINIENFISGLKSLGLI